MIYFNDLERIPAFFASMKGAVQQGYYWFYNHKQIGRTCYSEAEIKEIIKIL